MGYVSFVLIIACLPFLPSGNVPRWALLSIVAAVLLFRVRFGWGVIAFCSYLGLMAAVAPVGYDAAFILWHFLLYVVLFLYSKQFAEKFAIRGELNYACKINDIKSPGLYGSVVGSALGFWVNSAVVLAQWGLNWGFFPQVDPTSGPAGMFYLVNFATEPCAMVLALCVGYRLWWLIPGLLPTLLLGSRAPILALGIAAGVALWRRGKSWTDPLDGRFLGILAALAAAIFVLARGKAGIYISEDLAQRIAVWRDTLPHLTLLGHGIGSWIAEFPAFQISIPTLRLRFENTHNDYLQIAYELGLPGVILIGILFLQTGRNLVQPEAYAMIIFLMIAVFDFPLYEPVSGYLAALCAGRLFSGGARLRLPVPALGLALWRRLVNRQHAVFRVVGAVFSAHPLASLRSWLLRRVARRSQGHLLHRGSAAP